MIPESQQEQASLYALGLLGADEAAAFEQEISTDADLRAFVRELQETIALLAWAGDQAMQTPPPELRQRILAEVEERGRKPAALAGRRTDTGKNGVWREPSWFPWTVAALFSGCAGVLCWLYLQQLGEIRGLRGREQSLQGRLASAQAEIQRNADPVEQVSFCTLEPTPNFTTAQPRAMVLWDAARWQGRLRINGLAPPVAGKDYQLWAVEKDRKEPVSAGVFHVGADGTADLAFQPTDGGGKPVAAVAISLEEAGGSPTNRGPILLLGKF